MHHEAVAAGGAVAYAASQRYNQTSCAARRRLYWIGCRGHHDASTSRQISRENARSIRAVQRAPLSVAIARYSFGARLSAVEHDEPAQGVGHDGLSELQPGDACLLTDEPRDVSRQLVSQLSIWSGWLPGPSRRVAVKDR